METPNNKTNKQTSQEMSIQIGLNGLSFSVLDTISNTITAVKQINFDRTLNHFELLNKIKQLFTEEKALHINFEKVTVIYDNELFSIVPKPLFNEDALLDYLKFNSRILKTDFISFDELTIGDNVCVFVPYVSINNYLIDRFGSFTFKHISTILIESILRLEKNSATKKMYVNVNKTHFNLIVVEDSKLILYNTFKYQTKEDFIYYILFTAEQLRLNPEVFKLVFIGDIDKEDDIYKIAYKYIRHIEFGVTNTYNYHQPNTPSHANFSIINSF